PYMAPEQLLGQPCAASDLYSLGIVVYEWLCGERPFRGNEAEVVAGHLKSAPPSLRAHNPRVSPLLEEVVMIALSKEPDQRYPSARDFANAFKMALEDKRPTVPLPALTLPASNGHTPTKPASTGKSSRLSRRTVLTAVAGGVLVAGAAGGLAWYASTQFQSRAGGTTVPTTTATKVPPGTTLQIYRGHQDVVNTVAWSPDGSYIVSGGDDKVARVWDAATGKDRFLYSQHAGVVSSVACSPDSLYVISGSYDGTTQVWSAKDGKRSNLQSYAAQKITSVAWSPNRDRAAYAGAGGKVILFEAPSGKEVLHYASRANYTYAIAFSPDGTMVAIGSGGTDEPVQVWNIVNNRKLISYSLNANPVYAVAWSPDGKLIASGGYDKTVHVWKVATGESVFKYQEHQDVVNAIAWSGEVLASGSNDGVIKLWNAANGATLSTFSEHTGAVRSIFWSPDGTRVASASADKTVRVWQVG
ncbi:MAG: hypothetical protein J2P36_25500, partial [Ktedonobacteraceae bacterium]|nr:hypothetical protein [Ktedonobacteraceae bacterium]